MAQMILHGRELIRINTQKNYIEYSTNDGRSWHTRYTGTHAGNFIDLLDYGSEIITCTSKGIYFSMNKGISWHPRYTSSSAGSFIQLASDGKNLLATTSNGLYYSTNKGLSWHRR
ncbi:MAG: exo-alpha-sialidase [Aeriscardovia sp.]|nr:exo-alpha-sialidase [Aeriscardovia sp.]